MPPLPTLRGVPARLTTGPDPTACLGRVLLRAGLRPSRAPYAQEDIPGYIQEQLRPDLARCLGALNGDLNIVETENGLCAALHHDTFDVVCADLPALLGQLPDGEAPVLWSLVEHVAAAVSHFSPLLTPINALERVADHTDWEGYRREFKKRHGCEPTAEKATELAEQAGEDLALHMTLAMRGVLPASKLTLDQCAKRARHRASRDLVRRAKEVITLAARVPKGQPGAHEALYEWYEENNMTHGDEGMRALVLCGHGQGICAEDDFVTELASDVGEYAMQTHGWSSSWACNLSTPDGLTALGELIGHFAAADGALARWAESVNAWAERLAGEGGNRAEEEERLAA